MALDNESFDILLSTVQRFVRERLIPAENHLEEHDEVPPELVEDMKEMGLFGLTVPEEFGGIGLSVSQEVQVNFELGRTAPAFRSVFGTNIGIGSQGILMDGYARSEGGLPAARGQRRAGHVLRADRARCRLGRRLAEDAR